MSGQIGTEETALFIADHNYIGVDSVKRVRVEIDTVMLTSMIQVLYAYLHVRLTKHCRLT